ncbi:MAG: GPW/gp25 family protein [Nitrosomonas sp.]|jgi:phage baseplate assembly protein W|nr:GPW/gp25 family protein [Nitrosomonas sp.]
MNRIDYPFQFGNQGRTAQTDTADYIRDLIEQVLLTAPGERVMRPDFGSGVMQLVFAAASPEVAATAQFLVQGSLQQWLSDVIIVESVEVQSQDGALLITVHYVERRSQARGVAQVGVPGGMP